MNKKIIVIAAILAGTTAFAQYGPQYVGAAPTSTLQPALPGAATTANTGLSIQNGDDNKVRVRQAGTNQSVYTNQDNGSGLGGNLARVRQTGQVGPNSGVENAADVIQSGTVNKSTTYQEGDYNSAVTRQGQNNTASSGNQAWIRQGTGQQAENNVAVVDQDGDNNKAWTQQTYDNSESWTVQNGDGNESQVKQNAGPNNTAGHYAYTNQQGNANENSIDQSGAGESNWAWAYQTGNSNVSIQKQTETDTDSQGTGYVNYALADQGAFQNGLITAASLADLYAVDPDANPQVAALNPVSEDNVAFQTQDGGDLDAETHQYGRYNYSEQNQTGYGNDAFIGQNTNSNNDGNYGRQDQSGTQSFAILGQFGSGNKAWQRQGAGDDNKVVSSQIGDYNLLNTYQDGDGNRGNTVQHGEFNAALLVQRGGHSYTIEQDGTGNQADILQLGPNGDFDNDGIDCSFEDPDRKSVV